MASEIFSNELSLSNNQNLLLLENGNWKFYGIGKFTISGLCFLEEDCYQSNLGSNFNLQCALGNSGNLISLTGGTKNIALDFSSSNCENSIFSSSAYKTSGLTTLNTVKVSACSAAEFALCSSSSCPCVDVGNSTSYYGVLIGASTVPLATYAETPSTKISSFTKIINGSDASLKN